MRLLHTSDWHVGRTFHGADTVDALLGVLRELAAIVRRQRIDVVLVAGDIYDSAMPAGRHVDALTLALAEIRAAGAAIVLSSGNHDSAARLGANAGFARAGGLHLSTKALEPESWRIELADEHGPVQVYALPYLEPVALRAALPEAGIANQADAVRWAMDAVRASRLEHTGRAVVLAHCFAAGVAEPEDDAPRDITAGGLDVVPLTHLDGVDYVALGHIHSRQELSPSVRYSGAPLHYSFRERSPLRGGWLVDLDADGLAEVAWVELPVPRSLTTIEGELDALLSDPEHDGTEQDWLRVRLTDRLRPVDAMRRLKERWPHAAEVQWIGGEDAPTLDLHARLARRSEAEVVGDFLVHVRAGVGANEAEAALVRDAVARAAAVEAGL
ncbi:exonuclease SbcCD subunit D [Agrococcus sp. ARC_14]|uniref:exonuclease SbcCD subunit D n=1 Tax=Agrococcus sp. ARC_14 TaxID=2919927 RepID=UPI001F065085|nr:exonuclease SbcCD subunit D [Agrococcus sp. ARC_14]MCH1882578.1 exonuclease SbcCD subunit D [Agrococcus sp. ARC_14]